MFEPIGGTRPLPFPLQEQVSNGNIIPPIGLDVGDFVWPVDSAERTLLPLWISLDEWVAVNSAIDVGADIAYPEQFVEVISILMRQTRYKVAICSLIIDCINNDPDTLQAIIDGLQASDEFNTFVSEKVEGLTTGQITGPLIAGSCDNAVVAGKMMALVDALDQNNIDAIEIIEVGTNDEEKVASILEGIPIAGELPFGDIILFLQDMFEDLGENYLAASTTDRKEELARDLWCLALEKEDCILTYEDLFNFFQERISSGLTIESLLRNVLDWIITGDFSTDDLVFNMYMAAQIAFVRIGKEFFGVNMPKIGSLTRDASPSSIWLEWDACVNDGSCEGGTIHNFRLSEYSYEPYIDRAIWHEDEGWGYNASAATNRIAIMRNLSPHPTNIRIWTDTAAFIVIYSHIPGVSTTPINTATFVEEDSIGFRYELDTIPSYTGYIMIEWQGAFSGGTNRIIRDCVNYD